MPNCRASRFEQVDAGALCAGLVAAYRTAGLPAGVALEYLPPLVGAAPVFGDPARLAQVLRNLIDNALSFSPVPGMVLVSAETAPGRVFVRVEDQGPGVPAENRGDVFRRFYSQRPDSEDFGRHSGLGLSIAGAIIEAHGGSIRVDDRAGGGARFHRRTAGGVIPTVHATAVALAGRCVLLLGPSGAGKSDLALRLLDRGWRLVADDRVVLTVENGAAVGERTATARRTDRGARRRHPARTDAGARGGGAGARSWRAARTLARSGRAEFLRGRHPVSGL